MAISNGIEMELRNILDSCVIKDFPEVCSWSWVCILKRSNFYNEKACYRVSHTGRQESFKRMAKNDPLYSTDWEPIFIKVQSGAGYFIKVLRRIFKEKHQNIPGERTRWFALTDSDISWLSGLKLANSSGLEAKVQSLFHDNKWTMETRMKREGLF